MNRTKTIKFILIPALIFILVASTVILGLISNGFTDWDKFKTAHISQPPIIDGSGVTDGNGNEITGEGTHPMPSKMMFSAPSMMSSASNGVTLSATIKPISASNKAVDWTVAWVNASASFASGKTVTDYLTITPISDGATTANISCSLAFGEKIKITVTSRDNPDAKAECTVDYAQRLKSVSVNVTYKNRPQANFSVKTNTQSLDLQPILHPQAWYGVYMSSYCENEFIYSYDNAYTVSNSVVSNKIEVKASTELVNALKTQGLSGECTDWLAFNKLAYGDLIFGLGGPSLNNASFLNTTNYNKLLTAFGATASSDFQVRITTAMTYGESVVTTYTCHYSHASAGLAVESVELGDSTLIV